MILLTEHMSDYRIDPLHSRVRARKLGTWLNYRRSDSGLFQPVNRLARSISGVPYDWRGQYDFNEAVIEAPLQTFFGDATDPSNRCMWGMRLSSNPNAWVQFKAVGVTTRPTVRETDTLVSWRDTWSSTDLFVHHFGHGIRKRIRMRDASAPRAFRFSVKHDDANTFEIVDQSYWILRDAGGNELLRSKPIWAVDSTDMGDPADSKALRARMAQVDVWGSRRLPVIELSIQPDDFAGAVFPIILDPDTTLTGSTLLDSWMRSDQANQNHGANTSLFYQDSSNHRKPILRPDASGSVPSGTITDVTLDLTPAETKSAITASIYTILNSGNADWPEGTGTGQNNDGESCWNRYSYNDPDTTWAGSVGLGTAGTDYDSTDGVAITGSFSNGVTKTYTLVASWATAWRDTNNTGIVIFGSTGSVRHHSREGTTPPSMLITYTAGGASVPVFYHHYSQQRGAH
jgi:hypothetical protein